MYSTDTPTCILTRSPLILLAYLTIGTVALFLLATTLRLLFSANPRSPARLARTGWIASQAWYGPASPELEPAESAEAQLPTLNQFVDSFSGGSGSQIRGVYVPDVLALEVGQQPSNQPAFVTGKPGLVTQFRMAQQRGITGLLAHNYLSGQEFYDLWPGMPVYLVYGDGSVKNYTVVNRSPFQKLSPGFPRSNYLDLRSGEIQSTLEVFNQFYTGEHHLTFQTCLEVGDVSNWGLFFVVAVPRDEVGLSRTIFPLGAFKPH